MDKAYILLNFDQLLEEEDNRFDMVYGEYGFKATAVALPSEAMLKRLNAAGWDISTYGYMAPPNELLNDMSRESLDLWTDYVRRGKEKQADIGVTDPILWACRQNRWGTALEYGIRANGYKIARGGGDGTKEFPFITDYLKEGEIRTSHFGIYSRNIDDVKAKIDYAIENKYGLNIFTHWVVKTIEEDRGYDCIESVYRQMLDYVKEKVDQSLCECITYKEFYEICKAKW